MTAAETGVGYQWLRCSPYVLLNNETNQQFIAATNGEYAVIITQAGCADTSSCFEVSGIGLNETTASEQIQILPNPTIGIVNVTFPDNVFTENAILKNYLGQVISVVNITDNKASLNLSGVSTGVYYLEFWVEGRWQIARILRQ